MSLGGPTVGFQSFAVGVGVANECFYGIVNTADDSWEMGRGTVGAGTLSRDTVISSSNSNLLVNLIAGQKVVYTTVPRDFFEAALDAPAHGLIDHTAAPFNLMDTTAHQGVDHTAGPFNLLSIANLPAEHASIDHTSGPFNLLDAPAHEIINHTAPPFNLLTNPLHASINHLSLITSVIPQVSGGEKTAGTDINLKSYSPFDIADMVNIHSGGGAVGKLVDFVSDAQPNIIGATGTILTDNSIPLISEGAEIMSVAITPKLATNLLVIVAAIFWRVGSVAACAALFRHDQTNALACAGSDPWTGTEAHTVPILHSVIAGTTSPLTFSIRVGTHNGATIELNQMRDPAFGNYGPVGTTKLAVIELAL
jgi:hypothetical protein